MRHAHHSLHHKKIPQPTIWPIVLHTPYYICPGPIPLQSLGRAEERSVSSEERGEREGCDTASDTLVNSDDLNTDNIVTNDDTKHGDKPPAAEQGEGKVFKHEHQEY